MDWWWGAVPHWDGKGGIWDWPAPPFEKGRHEGKGYDKGGKNGKGSFSKDKNKDKDKEDPPPENPKRNVWGTSHDSGSDGKRHKNKHREEEERAEKYDKEEPKEEQSSSSSSSKKPEKTLAVLHSLKSTLELAAALVDQLAASQQQQK